ncbi:MAG TPA: SGNH/GDSL hydrolase family protein [Bdellovibrio sp.]|uniref:SGNH/GDSL hydrolase family protein n=1 Tax=Bdellovibrio sp. TaxID=28201 RepID=UPI002EF2BDBD
MLSRSVLSLFCFLPCVLVWTGIVLYSENSLYRHPEWIVEKRMLGVFVVGSDEYLISRSSLAQNQLHLGKWWGFHSLTYKPLLTPKKIAIHATLDPNSYLYVLFGDSKNRSGLRISAKADKPTAFVKTSSQGEIFEEKILDQKIKEGRHEIQLEWTTELTKISIDQVVIDEVPGFPEKGQLNLRGGREDVRVNRVLIEERDGGVRDISFGNSENRIQIFCEIAVLFLLIGLLFFFRRDKKAALFAYITVLLTVTVMGVGYYLFDFFVWSSIQQSHMTRALHQQAGLEPNVFEIARYNFFQGLSGLAGVHPVTHEGVVAMGYPGRRYGEGPFYCDSSDCTALSPDQNNTVVHSSKRGLRTLFIGTSQTVGAGAENIHQTFFALIHQYLQSHLKTPVESMNMAISGSHAKELIQKYHDVYQPFAADIVIIDLAFNDQSAQMEEQLPPFITELLHDGKKVILIQEATTNEEPLDNSPDRKTLAQIGLKLQVPVLTLHDYLNDPKIAQKGMIWWDIVHMTPFGQKLAAEWLAPQILEVIQRK